MKAQIKGNQDIKPKGSEASLNPCHFSLQGNKACYIDYIALIETICPTVFQTEKETFLEPFVLKDLLPSSLGSYYRYTGSLTTPPCSKVVEWIIFSSPVYFSYKQVRSMPVIQLCQLVSLVIGNTTHLNILQNLIFILC